MVKLMLKSGGEPVMIISCDTAARLEILKKRSIGMLKAVYPAEKVTTKEV